MNDTNKNNLTSQPNDNLGSDVTQSKPDFNTQASSNLNPKKENVVQNEDKKSIGGGFTSENFSMPMPVENSTLPSKVPLNDMKSSPNENTNASALPSSAPQQNTTPPPAVDPSSLVTIEKRKSKSFLDYLIPILIVIMLGIWAWVGYIFSQSKSGSQTESSESSSFSPTITEPQQRNPTYNPSTVRIENGSILINSTDGSIKVLADKNNFKESGIIGFSKVEVSPDLQKTCFESLPPAITPELYIADITGENVVRVGEGYKNCTWFPDSKNIFFLKYLYGSDRTDIFYFDTSTQKSYSITETTQLGGSYVYTILGLNADKTKLICTQSPINSDTINNCEIDIESLEFTVK